MARRSVDRWMMRVAFCRLGLVSDLLLWPRWRGNGGSVDAEREMRREVGEGGKKPRERRRKEVEGGGEKKLEDEGWKSMEREKVPRLARRVTRGEGGGVEKNAQTESDEEEGREGLSTYKTRSEDRGKEKTAVKLGRRKEEGKRASRFSGRGVKVVGGVKVQVGGT